MPTVHREGPYRFFFYSNEGDEARHVHVQRDDLLAKFRLNPVALAANSGFSARDLRRIEQIVVEQQTTFMEAWDEFFRS
jgi:hypothetical protein